MAAAKKNTKQPKKVTQTRREVIQEALPEAPPPVKAPRPPGKKGKSPLVWNADRYVPWATALARAGLNKKQIQQRMRVGKTKFYEWVALYPEFAEALQVGQDEAAARVENALFQRCVGFEVEESKITGRPQLGADKKPLLGDDGKPVIVPERVERTRKKVVGDVTAQHIFLKAWKPDRYRETRELTGPHGEPLVPKKTIMTVLGTDEFREYDAKVRAKLAAQADAEEAKK
jgi:hypothetical protein